MALTKATLIDLNSNELVLDLDADTSITADTDDTIHFKIAGADELVMTGTAFTPAVADGSALGSTSLEWSDIFLADGAVINFGADQDINITHVADTGLTTNADFTVGDDLFVSGGLIDLKNTGTVSTIKFYCESSNAHAQSLVSAPHSEAASNTLTLPGTGGNARLVSTSSTATLTNKTLTSPKINEDVAVTSTATEINLLDGVTSTTAELNILDGVTATAAEINLIDGGTSTGTTAVADADGIITNDGGTMRLTTAATFKTYFQEGLSSNTPSSADGQALGSASLEWSDLFLADAGTIQFGNDQEVRLIHNADKGLILKHTATADDKPIILTLQTGETDMAANDVLGKIEFQAPDEGTGTDAVLVSAAIQARAEGDHSASSNATSIDFMTGASEAAATKLTITSAGHLLPGSDDAQDLGSASLQFRDVYTGDLNLNNTRHRKNEVDGTSGSWTIQEGDDNLYILNRLNGKKYKFKLEEIQ